VTLSRNPIASKTPSGLEIAGHQMRDRHWVLLFLLC
jgi:hypothetical protein